MKDKNRIWRLVARKLSGEASDKELLELDDLARDNPDIGFQIQVLTELWKSRQVQAAGEPDDTLRRIMARVEKEKKASRQEDSKQAAKPEIIHPFAAKSGRLLSNLKFLWRILSRNKAFSLINITGLAIGMASAILILLWIRVQLTTDQFHSKKDRIYQVLNRAKFEDNIAVWGSTPQPLAPALKEEFPQLVEEAVRATWVAAFVLKSQEKVVQTEGLLVDPGFLNTFDFPLRQGDPQTALSTPHSILVSENLAKKLFADGDAMGRTINIDSNALFTITGVLEDLPNNTAFSFDYLVPRSYKEEIGWTDTNWAYNTTRTFVLLKPGVLQQTANDFFRNVKKSHLKGSPDELMLYSIRDWWLRSKFRQGKIAGGRIDDVRMFSIIAAFILLIACINYMNLSTARSEKRAREVGIRKVMGAGKSSLIGRFIGESVLIAFLAGIIALAIVQVSLPGFNNLVRLPGFNVYTSKQLSIPYQNPYFWLAGIGFIVFTGVLAGSYPAFYLSGYRPISILQKTYRKINTLVTPRKVLVVFQFGFAIVLIISTIIIYRQIMYGKTRDPGYDQDNLAFVYVKGDMLKNYKLIRQDLFGQQLITDITRTSSPITDVWTSNDDYTWRGKDSTIRMGFDIFQAEDRFVTLHGLRIIAGRDFNVAEYPSDTSAIILSESAARRMGFENAVGEIIEEVGKEWHVIGVIKDFIPETPFNHTQPIVVHSATKGFGSINLKLNPALSKSEAKEKVSAVFTKHNPDYVVEYRRVEDEYANKFMHEIRTGWLAALFAGLTIFISCLGLFALATYIAESRIKEIGIRKVLGASVSGITTLLSKDLLKLVAIAFIVASPPAWWAMHNWLKNYPYHISISWWVFVLTGILAILVAFFSIGYQAIKAALANPVDSLRSE